MKKILSILTLSLLVLASCSNKTTLRAKLCPQIASAYKNKDWNQLIILTDSLIANKENINDMFVLYIEALLITERTDEAINLLNKKIEEEPDNYYAFYYLGYAYWMREEYDNAIKNFKTSIDIRPRYARPYLGLAETYKILDNKYEAIEYYTMALKLFLEMKYIEEIKLYSQEILSLDSTNVYAYKSLSYACNNEENYHGVAYYSLIVIQLSYEQDNAKDYFDAHVFLGGALCKMGEYKEALVPLEYICNNSPETLNEYDWIIYCYLATCYSQLGNKEKYNYYKSLAEEIKPDRTENFINELINMQPSYPNK